jgi:hypothetical protein
MDEPRLPETEMLDEKRAALPTLEHSARPKGQREDYRFFTNPETGTKWKALIVLRDTAPAMVDTSAAVAPSGIAVTVTVSPVDEAGKALRENDLPVVIDSWTHTFNHVEMSVPDFDPTDRIMLIVAERVRAGEGRLAGVDKIKALADKWRTGKKL